MVLDEGFIRISPSLQHRAAVKIIEPLLRDPEYKSMMRRASWNVRNSYSDKSEVEKGVECIVEYLEIRVNTLSVPGALIKILERCILYMTMSTVQWLVRVANSSPSQLRDQYWTSTVYELMNHLQWSSFGYVDSQKTLESYISNRETIDFLIWNQLCYHCLESEIRRFSKTIEWEECREVFFSALSVYWYQKIYGRSPTEEMFESEVEFEMEGLGEFEEKILLKHMFNHKSFALFPLTGLTVSGIKYFRNYVSDDIEFVKLLQPTSFRVANDDVIFYLLRIITANDRFALLPSHGDPSRLGLIDPLFQLPLILFFDDWVNMLETLDMKWSGDFFDAFGLSRLGLRYYYNNTVYERFQKVWRMFYQRFSLDREEMGEKFMDMFSRRNVMVCKLMLKDLKDHQRIHLIECGKDYIERSSYLIVDEEFLRQVLEEVLKNDQERELFSAIPKKIDIPRVH